MQANNINYPHSLIHLIQGNLFQGLPNEDPYAHLATFIEICNTVKISCVPHNCYSQQPKPQPIKYRGVEHLSDMLVHYNQVTIVILILMFMKRQ